MLWLEFFICAALIIAAATVLSRYADVLAEKTGLGRTVPVHLHAKVTEVGQLELSCITRDAKHKWKLEFNVREP